MLVFFGGKDKMKERNDKVNKLSNNIAQVIKPEVAGAGGTDAEIVEAITSNLIEFLTKVNEDILKIKAEKMDKAFEAAESGMTTSY